jgi:hypothetical protein
MMNHLDIKASRGYNYLATTFISQTHRVMKDENSLKKVLDISRLLIEGFKYSFNKESSFLEKCSSDLIGAVRIIGFYKTFKNLTFFAYPLNNQSVDREKLEKSLINEMDSKSLDQVEANKVKVSQWINCLLETKNSYSVYEFKQQLRQIIRKENSDFNRVNQLVDSIDIQKETRSLKTKLISVCMTIGDLGSNFATLQSWKVINFVSSESTNKQASEKSKWLTQSNIKRTASQIVLTALTINLGMTSYDLYCTYKKWDKTSPNQKEEIHRHLIKKGAKIVTISLDMTVKALSLLSNPYPAASITLGLISKSIGLTSFLVFP